VTTGPTRLSFGIKTSQMGLSYDDILTTWREADDAGVRACMALGPHDPLARGRPRCCARSLDPSQRAGRTDHPFAPRNHGHEQSSASSHPARKDGCDRRHRIGRTADFRHWGRGSINGSFDQAVVDVVRREFDAYGVDVVSTSDAIAALDEALTITRRDMD
jgi:hypothetical protein